MEKALSYISKAFKAQFPWIIVFFAIATLSILFNVIPPSLSDAKIVYMVGLLLSIIAILIISYAIVFYKDYKKFLLFERVPFDAEIEFYNNLLIFDEASLKDHFTYTETSRRLKNNMDENNYNLFEFEIKSSEWVPDLPDIAAIVEREKLTLDLSLIHI